MTKHEKAEGPALLFATKNEHKILEFERILKRPVIGVSLAIDEIQGTPEKVLEQKAIAAWHANGDVPIFIEDTSLLCHGMEDLPGSYADQFTYSSVLREGLLRWIKGQDRKTTFQVGIAIYDGKTVHTRIGRTTGELATELRGKNGFGFDDIFIPDDQLSESGEIILPDERKTNAEMTPDEKDRYSPRRKALELLRTHPIHY
jgi:non-canonical purine NTP pyrophosphatase (RdgB/HAM1 family)